LKERLELDSPPSGAAFATERELEEHFDVSRSVVRGAFKLLVADGVIVRNRGSGTFIAPPKPMIPVTGLAKALLVHRRDLMITVLSASERPPDRTVMELLDMEAEPTAIAQVTAVLHVEGRPLCFVDSHTSVAHVPWMLPAAAALHSGLEPPGYEGVELTRAQVVIESSGFGQWGASLFGVKAGDLALVGRVIQYGMATGSEHERPLEFARLVYRGSSVQLKIDSA
jgi:GntR family transcriptional regulator